MVQLKDITLSVVSQIDAKQLPEYSTVRGFDSFGGVAACYIPIHPGAQIWLEYSIDGPHPPGARYFFKMCIDGQVATSWDCTAKHEYHGKTVYLLHTVKSDVPGRRTVLQKSMAFARVDGSLSPNVKNDCIEICVYRIQHRRRIRDLQIDPPLPKRSQGQGALRIIGNAPVDAYRPARRYQYQLLDPQDEPYATFRFYCRTHAYLERHSILDADRSSSSISPSSPSAYVDARTSPVSEEQQNLPMKDVQEQLPSTPTRSSSHRRSTSAPLAFEKPVVKSPTNLYFHRHSLTLSVKDSIEDLPSTVPRSPQSSKVRPLKASEQDVLPSPTCRSSPLLPESLRIVKPTRPYNSDPNLPLDKSPLSITSTPPFKSTYNLDLPPSQSPLSFTSNPVLDLPPALSTGSPLHLPHRRHKPSHLRVTLNGKLDNNQLDPDHDLPPYSKASQHQHPQSRLLSPFTPGGILRRLSSAPKPLPRRVPTPIPVVPTVNEINAVLGEPTRSDEEVDERACLHEVNDIKKGSEEGTPVRRAKQMSANGVARRILRRRSKKAVEEIHDWRGRQCPGY